MKMEWIPIYTPEGEEDIVPDEEDYDLLLFLVDEWPHLGWISTAHESKVRKWNWYSFSTQESHKTFDADISTDIELRVTHWCRIPKIPDNDKK